MAKKNAWQLQFESIVEQAERCGTRPCLLLHACCAPCSSSVLERLRTAFSVTIYYYNPNIHPKAEYDRRLEELERFLPAFAPGVALVRACYDPEEFFAATGVRDDPAIAAEPEKGERCRRCYALRMQKAWDYAVQNGFDFFTTTLSISPHKDAQKINEIGCGFIPVNNLKYLPADFKKQNGYLRSLELSREYGLYRQDYCGCVYSMQNAPHDKATAPDGTQ